MSCHVMSSYVCLQNTGKVVPEGQLWSGVPAKFERTLTSQDAEKFAVIVEENVKLAELHALGKITPLNRISSVCHSVCADCCSDVIVVVVTESQKTWQVIEQEEYDFEQMDERSEYYYRRLTPEVRIYMDVALGYIHAVQY